MKTKYKWTAKELIKREGRRIAMMFGLSFKRKFDGEMYKLAAGGYTKAQADDHASKIRKEGHKVRVIETRVAKWCIYTKIK